jgi:hypothetical protein
MNITSLECGNGDSPDEPPYAWSGIPATPAIVEALILERFNGQLVERRVVVNEVLRLHIARGGLQSKAGQVTSAVKKALAMMRAKGLANNPSVGYWRIGSPDAIVETHPLVVDDFESPPPAIVSAGESLEETDAEIVLGQGNQAVYLYYLPTFRLRASDQGEQRWPCKIGQTDSDPLRRILAQAGTALPEFPVLALVIRCSSSALMERALHAILTIRGFRVHSSPGSEWFLTNPEEVARLAKLVDPTLASAGT